MSAAFCYTRGMGRLMVGIGIGIVLSLIGVFVVPRVASFISSSPVVSPIGKILEKPLEKYSINALSGRIFEGSQIVLDEAIATTSAYTKYTFHFTSDGKKVTGVAYETVELPDESLPLLTPMSEVAGRMAVHVGNWFLQKPNGGEGRLLAGVPGVMPGHVVILGTGVVSTNAAKMAMGLGAHSYLVKARYNLDDILERVQKALGPSQ